MLVTLSLDAQHTYTNLDIISGKVFLRVPSNTNVSSIVVKLEGESRTRLIPPSPAGPYNDRQRPVLEVHKLLYRLQVVFPPPNLQIGPAWQQKSYTLNTGQYEYPFSFKIPFNNACTAINSLGTNAAFSGLGLEIARNPTSHVKQTLPPTLSGFPGLAEIRYYCKVTVNRPSLFKENPRGFAHFNFLPIEPPRPPRSDGEAYARRQHQFNPDIVTKAKSKQSWLGGMFGPNSPKEPDLQPSTPRPPPRFMVDARLPNPAILTCNDDIPLRIIIKQLSERTEMLFLQNLQVELIGYTKIRAHEMIRQESNSWIVISLSNMAMPLGTPADTIGTESEINREYWQRRPLPNTVAPTFDTCNISRFYELEVRLGLGYGSYKQGQDQLVVLPLRLPVRVFSGIAPPRALLDAMASSPVPARLPLKPPRPGPISTYSGPSLAPPAPYAAFPQTPVAENPPWMQQYPPVQGAYLPQQGAPEYEEAPPPSYEDAVGSDLPPIDGPRRDYAPPPPVEGGLRLSGDEKGR
ncbi:hypothetical protein W97_06360 [Coniosporium apollinis CBS 100218]|uniref:Arrestin-like N-terminal domain-containing protein n=1 Tax=Coniosporium apollinis (strain CBS 100218) TaxID=1168221 RepID=R7YZ01_CONA1|nr:uncharacterized protein W97_06360 [Coniosporium apollinis CBS 100218]EON67107.1 hypothetical protein W97_06360 [Coniosporium apollinis CBS 100218]